MVENTRTAQYTAKYFSNLNDLLGYIFFLGGAAPHVLLWAGGVWSKSSWGHFRVKISLNLWWTSVLLNEHSGRTKLSKLWTYGFCLRPLKAESSVWAESVSLWNVQTLRNDSKQKPASDYFRCILMLSPFLVLESICQRIQKERSWNKNSKETWPPMMYPLVTSPVETEPSIWAEYWCCCSITNSDHFFGASALTKVGPAFCFLMKAPTRVRDVKWTLMRGHPTWEILAVAAVCEKWFTSNGHTSHFPKFLGKLTLMRKCSNISEEVFKNS